MRLVIDEKVRPYPLSLVGPHHFRYREAEAVDPTVVLARPDTHSLYWLDHECRRAIFVETPPDVDLTAAPFYCQAQYAAAAGLVAVDYDDLHALADRVDERRMILVYSVGPIRFDADQPCPVHCQRRDEPRRARCPHPARHAAQRRALRPGRGRPPGPELYPPGVRGRGLAELAELHAVIVELPTTVTPGTVIGRSSGADRRLAQGSAV